MKKLIKQTVSQVKIAFSTKIKNKEQSLECNYADNYYGDQYCQAKIKTYK
ncbi:hypothetical protein [Thalassotalea profundi]|uniref:Uncharacterized protein n=1 Tax=Thalassotalea profundi TaxID=2036687 RepID=A0ABQ3J3L3_9GAMM|nr:hypothetical protein [Thalassotalea profundi]GHE98234.1 hypothetical protein GCM10011501_29710 [Thalassotalea profundi]